MIAVVDSGGANLASVVYALERLGAKVEVTTDPKLIRSAPKVILPGVGAARRGMEILRDRELHLCIPELTQPVLGICLGMQLMFNHSEEGMTDCLGIIPGQVRRFEKRASLSIPHMGWNSVSGASAKTSALMKGIPDGAHFYFVHSYYAERGPWTSAGCEYGIEFSAIVEQDNFMGVQFHPERSGPMGERLLRNFVEL